MTHVTCRLTAKNRDQLRNSTLGNRVWATFTFLDLYMNIAFNIFSSCSISNYGISWEGLGEKFCLRAISDRRRLYSVAFTIISKDQFHTARPATREFCRVSRRVGRCEFGITLHNPRCRTQDTE